MISVYDITKATQVQCNYYNITASTCQRRVKAYDESVTNRTQQFANDVYVAQKIRQAPLSATNNFKIDRFAVILFLYILYLH